MNLEQLKQMKNTYVRVGVKNENGSAKQFYITVPFSYSDFSELEKYQQEAVCQAECARLGYGYKITSIDFERFYNPNILEYKAFEKTVNNLCHIIQSGARRTDELHDAIQNVITNLMDSHDYLEIIVNKICSQDDKTTNDLYNYHPVFRGFVQDIINRCNSNSFSDLTEKLKDKLPK